MKKTASFVRSGLLALTGPIALLPVAGLADVLVMKNGDRITGTVSAIYDSEVTVQPDYAGKFQVDVAAIEYIESDRDFELKLSLREDAPLRFLGPGQDGQQRVAVNDEVKSVPLSDLREVAEPEPYYDWDANVDVALNITRGNTDTDNNKLAGSAGFKHGNNRHLLTAEFVRERTDGDSTKRQDLVDYDYNWLFSRPWFFDANASYERDPIKDLDYRWIVGVGLGRDIWNSAQRFWSIQAGPGVQFEDRAGNSETQAVAQAANRMRAKVPGTSMNVFANQAVTYNLTGEDNTVLNTRTGLSMDFLEDWYLKLSYDWDWESDPAGDAEKADSTLRFGLGRSF